MGFLDSLNIFEKKIVFPYGCPQCDYYQRISTYKTKGKKIRPLKLAQKIIGGGIAFKCSYCDTEYNYINKEEYPFRKVVKVPYVNRVKVSEKKEDKITGIYFLSRKLNDYESYWEWVTDCPICGDRLSLYLCYGHSEYKSGRCKKCNKHQAFD